MRKNIIVFIILLIISSFKLNSQDLEGLLFTTGGGSVLPYIRFSGNMISLTLPIEGGMFIDARYSYNIINDIYQITVFSDPVIELYLLFDDEFGYFSIVSPYKYDSDILLSITAERRRRLPPRLSSDMVILNIWNFYTNIAHAFYGINTSSNFIDNGIEYSGQNLSRLFINAPWINGNSSSIGEYIEIDFSQAYIKQTDTIVMSNGFFSPSNHNLYYEYNRVKKIRIEDMDGRFLQEFDVLDTPNLQSFKLPGFFSKIRITILDVFHGNKYNQTCINYLTGVKVLYINP